MTERYRPVRLVDLVRQAFRQAYNEMFTPRGEPDVIHVSEVSDCLRKAFYYRTMDIPIPDDKLVILTIGGLIHRIVQKELTGMGFKCELELTHDVGPFTLVGHADALNSIGLLELKSVTRMPREPYHHHLLQTNAYMVMADVNYGEIVYISKAGGYLRTYPLRPDQALFDFLVSRACQLYEALQRNEPPKPEPSKLCRWCSAYPICRGYKRLSEVVKRER